MPAGSGGGGGASNFKLGAAFVELYVDNRKFNSGLDAAHKKLQQTAKLFRATFSGRSMRGAVSAVQNLTREVNKLQKALASTYRAQAALNGQMGGRPNYGASAAVVRAQAQHLQAQAAMLRAQAQMARANAFAAGGPRSRQALGPFRVRAMASDVGSALKAAFRGAGSVLVGIGRTFGGIVSGVLSGAARAAKSILRKLVLPVAIGGGVAGFSVAKVIGSAMKMESEETALKRITGESGPALQRLLQDTRTTASQIAGVTTEQAINITKMGAKLGIAASDLRLFTRDMAKFSTVLEDVPVEEATTRIARMMQVFHRGNHEAVNFASALVKLDNASTASAREILDIAGRLSGPFATFGGKPHEALALAAAAREASIPIETSGTAISQIVQRMASSRDMGSFAKLAGTDKKSFGKLLEGRPLQAFTSVLKGLRELNEAKGPVEVSRRLETLHLDGQRVRGTMLQLMRVVDRLDELLVISAAEWKTQGAVLDAYNDVAETTKAQFQRLVNNVGLLMAEMGRGLLPVVKAVADAASDLATQMRAAFEAGRSGLEAWGKKLGEDLQFIRVLFSEWEKISELAKLQVTDWLVTGAEKFVDVLTKGVRYVFTEVVPALIGGLGSALKWMLTEGLKTTTGQPGMAGITSLLGGIGGVGGMGGAGGLLALLGLGGLLGRGGVAKAGKAAAGAGKLLMAAPLPVKLVAGAGVAAFTQKDKPWVKNLGADIYNTGAFLNNKFFGGNTPYLTPQAQAAMANPQPSAAPKTTGDVLDFLGAGMKAAFKQGLGKIPGFQVGTEDDARNRAGLINQRIGEIREKAEEARQKSLEDRAREDLRDRVSRFLAGGAPRGAPTVQGAGIGRLAGMLLPGFGGLAARLLTPTVQNAPARHRLSPVQQAARAQVLGMKAMARRQAEFARYGFSPTAAVEARQRRLHAEQEARPKPTVGESAMIKILGEIKELLAPQAKAAEVVASESTRSRPGMYNGMVSGMA